MGNENLKAQSIETVRQLIPALEEAGLRPVVARNYENYPNFGHDLDLFVGGDLDQATRVFKAIASRLKWDRLTLCTHYAPYQHDVLCIPVFRFHQFAPLQTLQGDLFGGLILLGLPLIDRHSLCAKRRLEPQGRFHIMPPEWEHGYRIFQIQSLNPDKDHSKRTRYRKRILDFHQTNPEKLVQWGKINNLGNLKPALEALESDDHQRLTQQIKAAKTRFELDQLLRRPLRSLRLIFDRKKGLDIQFNKQPCGPKLTLSGDPNVCSKQLDYLVENQALPGWSTTEDRRERGWALVSFDRPNAPTRSLDDLLKVIFDRHETIYSSSDG